MPAERPVIPKFQGADFVLLILTALLGIHFFFYILLSLNLILHPFAIEDNEGVVLQLSYDLARGRPIYRPLENFPYVPGDYPPFYLLLNAAAIRLSGLNLWSGRLFSFLAMLGISTVLFLWIRRETGWGLWALALALCPCLSPLFFSRSVFYRVDTMAAFLSFAGVYCFFSKEKEGDGLGERLALACMLLALYTKHSMVAAPLACWSYLLVTDRRRAWGFLARLLAVGGTVFLILMVATRREFFRHLILYHSMGFDGASLKLHARAFALWTAPFAACWVILIAAGLARSHLRSFAVFYAAACSLHFVMLGRKGASLHYLLEPSAVCFLSAGLLLPKMAERFRSPRIARNVCVGALLALVAGEYLLVSSHYGFRQILQELDKAENRDRILLEVLRQRPGDILAQDQSYPLLAGRDSQVSPFHIAQLSREGKFDQGRILRALEERRFAWVILHSSVEQPSEKTRACFTDEVLAAVRKYYEAYPTPVPGRWVYEPEYPVKK